MTALVPVLALLQTAVSTARIYRPFAFVEPLRPLVEDLIQQARTRSPRIPRAPKRQRRCSKRCIAAQRDAYPADERLSDEDISGNLLTLLLAGEDTTSNTLAWMLHYAAHEPEVQRRLHEESEAVFAGDAKLAPALRGRGQASASPPRSRQETLRLRSAAPLHFYETIYDVALGDIAVPAGHAGVLVDALLRRVREQLRQRRSLFSLSAGSTHAGEAPGHNPRAALAFGGGQCSCPGRSLALFESAMVISMVARNFRLEPQSGRDSVEERFDFTMAPHGLRVRFHARRQPDRHRPSRLLRVFDLPDVVFVHELHAHVLAVRHGGVVADDLDRVVEVLAQVAQHALDSSRCSPDQACSMRSVVMPS